MYRFNDSEVMYNPVSQMADIDASVVGDDVYAVLEPHGVNVVGGRTTRVGVASFTLGGGLFEYSWISYHKELIICRRIFIENELIGFDSRHDDCVRACESG
jgi:hypothetical protein